MVSSTGVSRPARDVTGRAAHPLYWAGVTSDRSAAAGLREAWQRGHAGWVALLAIVVFAPALGAGYTLDDHQAVLGHPVVTGDAPLWEAFVRDFWGRPLADVTGSSSYRPLVTLSLALEHRVTTAPWLHHAVNVALFAGLGAQICVLARRWLAPRAALVAALLFVALPVHVENVASIVGRADVLAAIAGLAAIDLAVPASGTPASVRRGALAALAYLAALLCKEGAALLPLLVAWLALLGALRGERAWMRRSIAPVLVATAGAAYLAWRMVAIDIALRPDFVAADNLLLLRSGVERVWGNLAVLGHYTEVVAFPMRLCADRTYAELFPPHGPFERDAAWAWIGVVVLAALVVDGVRALRGRTPGLGFATLLAYLLVGQWLLDLSVIAADRLALWPSVWAVLAVVAATAPSIAKSGRAPVLVGLVLALFGARSVIRTLDWYDDVSLQRSSLDACPRAVHSRFILANALRERGVADESVWHYAVAAAGRSAFPERFDSPMLDAEIELPLAQRLPRIPELAGAPDPLAYWAAFHAYLVQQGATAEADLVRDLAMRASASEGR